jgi:NADH-quinone oxidoreductase subunit L
MFSHGTALSLVLVCPLIGSLLAFCIGSQLNCKNDKLGGPVAGWIATTACFVAFFAALLGGFHTTEYQTKEIISFGNWFSIGTKKIDFAYVIDSLSALFVLLITGVGALIHLYSVGYMKDEPAQPRYFALLNLFIFSMLNLVLAENYVLLFAGWEGVGVCSYLLVGFWYQNLNYAKAAKKAFIVNRIGDAFFLGAIFISTRSSASFGIDPQFFKSLPNVCSELHPCFVYSLVPLFMFLACAAKSAQFPLFVWLPDAMAGPTPVSALIHAATMVTAGIYLVARIGGGDVGVGALGLYDPQMQLLLLSCCLLTALIGAFAALCQKDIKKVLAYSTVSQLGLMMFAAILGFYHAAVFHVVTHAFFKAALFLCAGSIIHACNSEQDMRRFGGLLKKLPITSLIYGVSVLAIAGIYPLAGYFSKHAITGSLADNPELLMKLNPLFAQNLAPYSTYLLSGLLLVSILTGFYMTRSFVLTFLGEYRGEAHPHEAPLLLLIPKLILLVGVIIGGFSLEKHIFAIFDVHHHESLTPIQALFASWPGLIGVVSCLVFYLFIGTEYLFFERAKIGFLAVASETAFGIDCLYNFIFVRPYNYLAATTFSVIEKGVIFSFVNFCWISVAAAGEIVARQQNGLLTNYVFGMLLGMLAIIILFF